LLSGPGIVPGQGRELIAARFLPLLSVFCLAWLRGHAGDLACGFLAVYPWTSIPHL